MMPVNTTPRDPAVERTIEDRDGARETIMRFAADRLQSAPFMSVTLDMVTEDTGLPSAYVRGTFRNMHEIGCAILDHERASMHSVQEQVSHYTGSPLERLAVAFRLVGDHLANDIVVRAGVRVAAESREHFPERRLDPFRTWEAFITTHLTQARDQGMLRADLDLPSTTWILVAAGIGTKDLVAFHDTWADAAERLESTVRSILTLISAGESTVLSLRLRDE